MRIIPISNRHKLNTDENFSINNVKHTVLDENRINVEGIKVVEKMPHHLQAKGGVCGEAAAACLLRPVVAQVVPRRVFTADPCVLSGAHRH